MNKKHPDRGSQSFDYAIPFGRTARKGHVGRAGPEFVGRDGERAFLTEALTSGGSRGSYLVTGRRGVGKTSFVESCVEEYEASVFKRFLRSRHGRSMPDLFLLTFFVLLVFVALLVASDLLEQIASARGDNGLMIFLALPLIGLILVPMIYAQAVLKAAFNCLGNRYSWGFAFGTIAAWTALISVVGPFGAPALSLSRFALATALFLLAVVSLPTFTRSLPKSRGYRRWMAFALTVAFTAFVLFDRELIREILNTAMPLRMSEDREVSIGSDVANNLLLTWFVFVVIVLRNNTGHSAVFRWMRSLEKERPRYSEHTMEAHRTFLKRILQFALLLAFVLLLAIWIVASLSDASEANPAAIGLWGIGCIGISLLMHRPYEFAEGNYRSARLEVDRARRFVPPIEMLLLIKALFFATVSLQLVYPAANLAPGQHANIVRVADRIYEYPSYLLGIDSEGNVDEDAAVRAEENEPDAAGQEVSGGTGKVDANSDETGSAGARQQGLVELAGSRELLICAYEIIVEETGTRGCKPSRQNTDTDIGEGGTDTGVPETSNGGQGDTKRTRSTGASDLPVYLTLFENQDEETIWIIAALFIMALLFLAEFDWINRSMIAERQSSALGLTPRYPADNRAHSHLDPVWIREARARIMAVDASGFSGGEKQRDELLAGIPEGKDTPTHDWRVSALRRVERATLPWLIVRIWMPAIIVRVNLGFDTLDHHGVTRAMLFGLRSEYQKKFLNIFSGYAVLVNFVTLMGVVLTVSYIGESAFDFPRVRYVTDEGKCDFATKKGGSEKWANQGCAVFDEENATWTSFFEGKVDDNASASGPLDYCNILSNRLSKMPEADLQDEDGESVSQGKDFDSHFRSGNATIPRMLCDAAPKTAALMLPILFAEVLPIDIDPNVVAKHKAEPGHLVFSMLHDNQGLPRFANGAIRTEPSLSLRVYHILSFLVLLALWNWASKRYSIHPYRTTVRHIDGLMQSLDARATHRRRSSFLEPITRILSLEQDEQVEHERLDPRSVELALLSVLEEVRHTENGLFGGAVTLPVPELTFVFDELDKISGVVGAGTNAASSAGVDKTALDQERRRAYALHQLLSDMKRVISSAPARFVFVGNRLLHDEWTADRSRRQPLLTSIFDTEIYLPSLMLDTEGTLGAGRPQKRLSHRTKEYLRQRHSVAQESYGNFVEDRLSPFPVLREHERRSTPYPQDASANAWPRKGKQTDAEADWTISRPKEDGPLYDGIRLLRIGEPNRQHRTLVTDGVRGYGLRTQFLRAFCHFLTFRSGGNPKKLQELLNEFIRPAARLSRPDDTDRWIGAGENEPLHCEDVLFIHGRSIYRIQLIDTLYMHLVERFEQELIDRDDKVAEAILYLFDFLMKFHTRAFSWSSLERVEELVYIHRTPDLRAILTRIVEDASERWLHRLLNGMYDFRFRSDFAIELRYLSRLNQAEAAALNFTLDEAQGLKATFIAMLHETTETGSRRDQEVIAGLGELHEYDQEFSEARSRYIEAIDEIDARFSRLVGETVDVLDPIQRHAEDAATSNRITLRRREAALLASRRPGADPMPVMRAIMSRDATGMRVAAVHIPWAIRRLRLMLQVAMTYELSRDFEPAKVHYLDARMFAWSLIEMFPKEAKGDDDTFEKTTKDANIEAANDLAKHINLLYQPIFAEAWVSEKLENGIDTASSLVEGDLLRLRRRLPFLGDLNATKSKDMKHFMDASGNATVHGGAGNSNMALIGAELHNKAGDLYFFKGKGAVPTDALGDYLVSKEKHEEDLDEILELACERWRAGDVRGNADRKDEEGYGSGSGMLLRAHYHYVLGLHELRRYVVYRRLTSGSKINPLRGHGPTVTPGRPVGRGEWPTFVPQSIYNNISDMAEAVLARVSFFSLLRATDPAPRWSSRGWGLLDESCKDIEGFTGELEGWFERTDDEIEDAMRNPSEDAHPLSALLYETLGLWVGDSERLKEKYPHLVSFGTIETPVERLAIGFALSATASRFAEKAGYPEDAAREEMLVMELCGRYLKWIAVVKALYRNGSDISKKALRSIMDECSWERSSKQLQKLEDYLGRIAVNAAQRYDALTWRAWRRRAYKENCLIGQPISPEAVTIVCTLAHALRGDDSKILLAIAKKWFGDCGPQSPDGHDVAYTPNAGDYLRHGMQSFRYPALNQLLAHKSIIDAECLRILNNEGKTWVDIHEYFRQLRRTYEQLGAPLHFTPSMIGETAALIVMVDEYNDRRGGSDEYNTDPIETTRMIRRAIEALTASREAYSMGRAYYSAIAEMYYLYDDYNDRRIHANHAAQMAGGELHALMLHVMNAMSPFVQPSMDKVGDHDEEVRSRDE